MSKGTRLRPIKPLARLSRTLPGIFSYANALAHVPYYIDAACSRAHAVHRSTGAW